MLRAILIDDEPLCTSGLEVDLKAVTNQIEVIAKCNSAKEGLQKIKDLKPDVVFLDIEMPWMNGFEMIDLLMPIDFKLIFVTAYDEFAVKAFQVHAIDYLMKPVDRKLLKGSIERIIQNSGTNNEDLKGLIEDIQNKTGKKRITVPNNDGLDVIEVEDIVYCQAQGNYTDVYLMTEKKKLVCRVLKEIEGQLNGQDFFRVHNSFLVNIDHIKSFHRSDGGYVVMNNGDRVPVSRGNKSFIVDLLKDL